MLPPQVPMPRPATTPRTSLAADQFHTLAALPPAIERFPDITNTNTRRAQRQDIRDFEAFAGSHQPEQFRDVTRTHGIAWCNHLVRQGVAATVLSGFG